MLDYLRAAERIDAATAALKARARVALAGATASEQVLDELHVEAELATATRSSRYVAGMSIERARVLTTIFPAFLDALAEGAIAEAHCRTLVEKTRPVTDPVALAAIGRVLLPKAKRLAPGPFAREVATAIARFDPDAASRYTRAREQRSVWTRELEDGMSLPRHGPRHLHDHRDEGHARRRRAGPARAATHGGRRGPRHRRCSGRGRRAGGMGIHGPRRAALGD